MPPKKPVSKKLDTIKISPSRAYLLSKCFQSVNIKSGNKLLTNKNSEKGVEKHELLKNDLSIVKKYLPETFPQSELKQEQKLSLSIRYGFYKFFLQGTSDLYYIDHDRKKIYVFDWKTGGSDLETLDDTQLVLYANLVLSTDEKTKHYDFSLSYVNPDLDTVLNYQYSYNDLTVRLMRILDNLVSSYDSKRFNVGQHCQYCPQKSACPELLKNLKDLLNPKFSNKPIESFSEIQIDLIAIGEKVISELKDKVKTYLILNPEKELYGYKIGDKKGKHTFKDFTDFNEVAKLLKTDIKSLQKTEFKTVSQLDKEGWNIEAIRQYIFQPTYKVLKKPKSIE